MIINTKDYPDFKMVSGTLRHLDAVFYNDAVNIQGSLFGVAYAFDYESKICVALLSPPGLPFPTSDFPGAIQLVNWLFCSEQTATETIF